jgi:hypothetical protein
MPQIYVRGVSQGQVLPVDEAILSRWFFRPWPTGRKLKILRTFVIVRAVAMGLACLCFLGVPVILVFILIGPSKQLPLGVHGWPWLGVVPRLSGFGWWDGNFDRWDFIWFKSSFAVVIGVLSTVVGYAAGTSRQLVLDMHEKKLRQVCTSSRYRWPDFA